MAKRKGDEPNPYNWDQETEREEPGTFEQADTDELLKRVIKKAKRSLPNSEEVKSASPFSAFQGFSMPCNSSPLASKSEEGDVAAATNKEITKGPQIGIPLRKKSLLDAMGEAPLPAKKPHTEDSSSSESSHNMEYFRQLQALNSSVVKWMELNLTKDPCSDFTPVFDEYKMHLQRLEKTYLVPQKLEKTQSFSSSKERQNDFKQTSDAFPNALSNAVNNKPGTTNEKSEHSFFPQSVAAAASSTSDTGTEEEDYTPPPWRSIALQPLAPFNPNQPINYTPPPNDFVAVTEEDTLYSKKCKLFFLKEGAYSDKGVGMLYIKKLEDKTQLLIRADTSLGNVLLNIILSATLPIERTGKNNVIIVCIPNPPLGLKNVDKNEAVPFLVRVKTSEDADELYEKLNEFKT